MLAAVLEALDEYVAWLEEERKEDDEGASGEEEGGDGRRGLK